MPLHAFEFRSAAHLVTEISESVPLVVDAVYVALVEAPSTRQELVDLRRLATPARTSDWLSASQEIYDVMQSFPIPDEPRPPRHATLTVVVRPGLCVFGPGESVWMRAWRYSNHLRNAFQGELVLVTEHGWAGLLGDTGGYAPAMVA